MAEPRKKKTTYYPRTNGMRRQERCRECGQWTPIGEARNILEVRCVLHG